MSYEDQQNPANWKAGLNGVPYYMGPAQYRNDVTTESQALGPASVSNGGTGSPGAYTQPQAPAQSGGYYGQSMSGGVNPNTTAQANSLRDMVNQNLSTNIMPGIRSSALGNGSYGGSRQGVAEGVAAGQASTGLASSLANLYSGNYQFDTNAGMQQQGLNNNFALGLGQLGNQSTAQNQNFYTNQRGQDLQQYQLGSNMYGAGVQGNVGLGSGMFNTGQAAMNAPTTALNNYSNTISPYSGLGGGKTTTEGGSTLAGALGGVQIGNAMGNSLSNLWGGSSSSGPANLNGPNAYSGYGVY